jgi:formylmethanofuran dehydrogenase subunit C
MTIDEKLKMYREKSGFIADIDKVFTRNSRGHSVNEISYEVWHKNHGEDCHEFLEWIIVAYDGGAKSYLMVTANSNTANFRAIGEVLDHGNYSEIDTYRERQVELGFKKVNLAKLILTEEE